MNKVFKLILYYFSLLLGLVAVSWIIWARFIRTRTIREIPDSLLTEYRFWILLYICCIYLYVVKNLIKPEDSSGLVKNFIDFMYTPLKNLDHVIKYNKYTKLYYYKMMQKLINNIFTDNTWMQQWLNIISKDNNISYYYYYAAIYSMQIIPRMILVTFLLLDTFYYNKLEIFYKVILIGALPLMYRYIKYSLKDIEKHWLELLNEKYENIFVYEKGYEYNDERKGNTEAIYHDEKKSIEEYIKIKMDNEACYNSGDIDYEYVGDPIPTDEFLEKFALQKYNDKNFRRLTAEDFSLMATDFNIYIPYVIKLRFILLFIELFSDRKMVRFFKIMIFSLYFICWSFILIISYIHFPIELVLGKKLIKNIILYLTYADNPFSELYWGSLSENLITIENMKNLLKRIFK